MSRPTLPRTPWSPNTPPILFTVMLPPLIGILLVLPESASALSCVEITPSRAFAADLAVVGRVTEHRGHRYSVDVERTLIGRPRKSIEVTAEIDDQYQPADVGDRLGMLLTKDRHRRLHADPCSTASPPDLEALFRTPEPTIRSNSPTRFVQAGSLGCAGVVGFDAQGRVTGWLPIRGYESAIGNCPDGQHLAMATARRPGKTTEITLVTSGLTDEFKKHLQGSPIALTCGGPNAVWIAVDVSDECDWDDDCGVTTVG